MILTAARRVFSEHGYYTAKVDDVAQCAGVSPATVYAVAGGKAGIRRALIEAWINALVLAVNVECSGHVADGAVILDLVANGVLEMRREWGDVMRLMLTTAPHDADAAELLAHATERYRAGLLLVARLLAELGQLRPGVDVARAEGLLWFYFGYSSLFTLVDDLRWSAGDAMGWLRAAAGEALLASGTGS